MKTTLSTFPKNHNRISDIPYQRWKKDLEASLRKRLQENRLIRDNGTQPHLRLLPITVQLDLVSIKELLGEK